MNLEEIIDMIAKHANKPKVDIKEMIKEKQTELSDLVSEEGAAYIVGRELGVSLLKESKRQLKIKNLVAGLRSVELVVKVVSIKEPYEFTKNGRTGRVSNINIGDETGVCRLSLWDAEIDILENNKISVADVIRISRATAIMDNMGNPEVRLSGGKIEKVNEVVNIDSTQELEKSFMEIKRGNISDFKEGDFREVLACVVQIYRRNPFYEVCPKCEIKLNEGKCKDHGEVEPKPMMVLSGVIDDGTGNIRAVFFRETAEKLFGDTTQNIYEKGKASNNMESVMDDFKGLGKDFIFKGKVKKNDFTGNMEIVVNDIRDVDVNREIEKQLS